MDGTKPHSLGEKFFLAARDLPGVEQRYQENIARGQAGTAQDAEQRLADIAATLKQKLETFITDVAEGRTRIAAPGEAYRHDGEPLRFQIALPAGLDHQDAFDLFNSLRQGKAVRQIVDIANGPDVDMAIRTSFLSDSLIGGGEPPRTVYSLVIDINPDRPAANKTLKPKGAGAKP